MKILVLGASAQIGQYLVAGALGRGHAVTALVRDAGKLSLRHERLDVVVGSPIDAPRLREIVIGKDAVLSTLGHVDLKPSTIVADAARATLEALRGEGRLIVVSSTLVAPGGSFLTRIPRWITRHALEDSTRTEEIVKASSVDWTLLRLSRLTNGDVTPFRVFEDEPPSVTASVSRATVAACMLDAIADARTSRRALSVESA